MVYLFGGKANPSKGPAYQTSYLFGPTNDIWSMNLTTPNMGLKFENGSMRGYDDGVLSGFPRARFGHKCLHKPGTNTIYIYGGVADETTNYPRRADEKFTPWFDITDDLEPSDDLFGYWWYYNLDNKRFDPYFLNDMWILRVIDSENPVSVTNPSPITKTEEAPTIITTASPTPTTTNPDTNITILGLKLSQGVFIGAIVAVVGVIITIGVIIINYTMNKKLKSMNIAKSELNQNLSPVMVLPYSSGTHGMSFIPISPNHITRGSNSQSSQIILTAASNPSLYGINASQVGIPLSPYMLPNTSNPVSKISGYSYQSSYSAQSHSK